MTPSITVIVHGLTSHRSLAACLDSLVWQKRLSWIHEIIVLLPPLVDEETQLTISDRQRRLPNRVNVVPTIGDNPLAETPLLIGLCKTEWLAFLSADSVAHTDWIEQLHTNHTLARKRNPLIAGVCAPIRYADVGRFSAILNTMVESPMVHLFSPRFQKPESLEPTHFLCLENALLQKSALEKLPDLGSLQKPHLFEPWLGQHLKNEGHTLVMANLPVIRRREMAQASVWFKNQWLLGEAQAELDTANTLAYNWHSHLARLVGGAVLLTALLWPISNWLLSFSIVYLLIVLNGAAGVAFKYHEWKRLPLIFGAMLLTHMNFIAGYWAFQIRHKYALFVAWLDRKYPEFMIKVRGISLANYWRQCRDGVVNHAKKLFLPDNTRS